MSQEPPCCPPSSVPRLEGAVVQQVTLVDLVTRGEPVPFRSVSLPGHLIHLVAEGRVEQTVNGVRQQLGPGDTAWYYENEEVQGRILEAPWTFYTVNFFAPTLSPPPIRHRVCRAPAPLAGRMELLLAAWRDTNMPPTVRHLRVHALLLEAVLDLLPESMQGFRVDSGTELWWDVEAKVRADLSHSIDMKFLERLCRRSQRTIIRACRLAVGKSPMKRIKEIRLSYARGLVQLSDHSISDIACRTGYGRVQEFSRDYRSQFGVTPSEDRLHGLQL